MTLTFHENDGGKNGASSGDCGIRAAAIATGRPYREVRSELNILYSQMTGGLQTTCNNGVDQSVMHKWLTARGWSLTLTKSAYANELPTDRTVIACLPRHFMAVLNGVVNDTYPAHRKRTTSTGFARLLGYYHRGAEDMEFEETRERVDSVNRATFTLETAENQPSARHILEWNHAVEEITRIIWDTLERQP